jgi:hypothetical protein
MMSLKKILVLSLFCAPTLSVFCTTLATEPFVPEAQQGALQRCLGLGLRYGVSLSPSINPICGRVFELCIDDRGENGGCFFSLCEERLDLLYNASQIGIAFANTALREEVRQKFSHMEINADTIATVNSYTRANLKANEERSGCLSEEQVSLLNDCMLFLDEYDKPANFAEHNHDLQMCPLQFFDTIGGLIECMKENNVLQFDKDERTIRSILYYMLLSEFNC